MSSSVPSTPLPEDFTPSDNDVVIGKGKKYYFHAGNQWLRNVVAERIESYSQAVTKADKSCIISEVVDYVNKNGRFVRLEITTCQWVYAEPLLCREKCSQTFRDNLAQTYRSSNVAKRNKRRQEQQDRSSYPSMGMGFFTSSNGSSECSVDMPSAKRMRFDMVVEPQPMISMQQLQQEEIVSEDEAPAAWFDWEMPIRNLESSFDEDFSFEVLEEIFQMATGTLSQPSLDAFTLDFSAKASASPMVDYSMSNIGIESAFQQCTAAAFAA